MSRLTLQEVIEHCERTVQQIEKQHERYQIWLELEPTTINLKRYWEHKQTAEWLKELKHYKDLKEQGRLIELPCKPDEFVYAAHEDCRTVKVIYESIEHILADIEGGWHIGYTKEEAEAKLEELKGTEDEPKEE